jgi:hypothetical protein
MVQPGILTNQLCYIPVATLIVAPWSLDWGSSIDARVKVSNIVGDSEYSDVGNGAVIASIPDKPTNLANNELVSTMS